MATPDDIAAVRANTNEPTDEVYSDEEIAALVDGSSVEGASGVVWERKAAKAASSVDVTEAGASHKFSDVYKAYSAQAAYWLGKVADATGSGVDGRVRVKKIVRS